MVSHSPIVIFSKYSYPYEKKFSLWRELFLIRMSFYSHCGENNPLSE